MKTFLMIIVVIFALFPVWLAISGIIDGLFIEPIKDKIKNGKNAETKTITLIKRFAVLGLVVLFILSVPFIVNTQDGETTCKNLLGYTMKCH